ncbi:MAG: type II secretion system protein [Steroidobacteraceae bacterium]
MNRIGQRRREPTAACVSGRYRRSGFTLLEMMFSVCVCSLVVAIAVPTYGGLISRQKTTRAIADIAQIGIRIEKYRTTHGGDAPLALDELGAIAQDPWGRDYQYLNFDADVPGIKGLVRKDHNLHPLNSQFDLYSFGPDGKSRPPLTAKASRDDIVFGRDGGFIGPASAF